MDRGTAGEDAVRWIVVAPKRKILDRIMKRYRHTEELQRAFQERKDRIRRRLREYAAIPQEQYFYELVYCLMTPQSSAVNAGKAKRGQ